MWPADVTRRLDGPNPAPQNLNDLRAAIQDEWNAMPQQTVGQLVNSMSHNYQAVIDAKGHILGCAIQ